MAAPALLRAVPLLRHRLILHRRHILLRVTAGSLIRRPWCSVAESTQPEEHSSTPAVIAKDPPSIPRWDDPDYRKWKDKEEEILEDIEPVICLAKEIIHSDRYVDGERLTADDERVIVDKLLAYHPHAEDKIGCGLDSIMVDRHPQFRHSRCLFVVRTNGVWIDFSYQKCLRAYIRDKYPSHAERFIKEHFKRGSG